MPSRSTFLTLAMIAYAAFGLAALVAPGPVMGVYGLALDGAGELVTRSLAVAFIGLALPLWWARSAPPSAFLSGLLLAHALYNAINVPVVLFAVLGGPLAATGWGLLLLHVVLAAAFFACWRGLAVASRP